MESKFVDDIRRFYKAHKEEVYTYALALTKHSQAAEDVIHTVFYNLLRRGRTPRELRGSSLRATRQPQMNQVPEGMPGRHGR